VLTDELLRALRVHLCEDTLAYAEPPQRLGGGFFTENHAFRLAGALAGWDVPLVVRLFPNGAPPDLAFREASVQTALTAQHFPAAPVLWFDNAERLDDRRFFVMQRLPGRALVGGIRVRELISAVRFSGRLPEITAAVQARLHHQDPSELARTLGDGAGGVGRSFAMLEARIDEGAGGFGAALQWLVEHRPRDPARGVICHGDLWGGNILVDDKGRISGVLDWSTSTIAEPAFDVGATALAFCLIPVPFLGPIRPAIERRGRALYHRYLRAYQRSTDADLRARPYYEALRCATELSFVAAWRLAGATGAHDLPRPSWDVIPEALVKFFRSRTGVTIVLPPRAS
jgi:aminoglycoside phosphotransferase (APT) family kinase protein